MADNVPEYSVTELAGKVKKTVEDAFGYVRVRGELGRVTKAGSGHVYLDLKDDRAVLSSVIWKGAANRLKIAPEQGMEVVATGRLTTFPGQSRYQLVIDTLEPAGAGALMALLEARKKALAAEGLFDEERKQALPSLPGVIGVVTSPSGAVIRDILHRLRDRFPSHVLVWPTLVQGESAAPQIMAGIEGFNRLPLGDNLPRPDILIVARGGGSLEDLWCFNDEGVVRAAAASTIPLISAVGHETDTTLIDFAADRRAPTPTAAAEMAVPVRLELLQEVAARASRLGQATIRLSERRQMALTSAARGLGRPQRLMEAADQRLDRAAGRLGAALGRLVDGASVRLGTVRGALTPTRARQRVQIAGQQLDNIADRLTQAPQRLALRAADRLAAHKLPLAVLRQRFGQQSDLLATRGRLLDSYSHKSVLERGFAMVLDEKGGLVRRASDTGHDMAAQLQFADGTRHIRFVQGAKSRPATKPAPQRGSSPKKGGAQRPVSTPTKEQGGLFD
ncbi:MAG: exodeoxyribonuclease VII large subunit [Pseudomonadota bacterium]